VTPAPLRRNRDFVLLQTAAMLSSAGSQMSAVAYPLLVLALTGSPAKAGIVAFVRLSAMAILALPAGVAADRWDRRWVMIAAHAMRAVAIGTLAALIFLDHAAFWAIPMIAFVEGAGAALFQKAQVGALRAVVPRQQLPSAVAVQTGREAATSLVAPPLGGALFVVARALPFVVHTVSYAFSALVLLAIRTPFQEERARDASRVRSQIADGFRFLWNHAFLRTCAFLYGLTNFIGPGVFLAIVIIGKKQGLSGGAVGLLLAVFGGCLLIGAFLSALLRGVLPVRAVLLLELWTWVGCSLFLIWPDVYVLAASLIPTALAIPATDSVVGGYQLAMTPDRLLGRVESVRGTIALLIAPLGPLAAGVLLDTVSARATIAVFAATGLVLALWGTFSPAIRAAPDLDELKDMVPLEGSPATSLSGG
jgi:Transmembrane secretion effector